MKKKLLDKIRDKITGRAKALKTAVITVIMTAALGGGTAMYASADIVSSLEQAKTTVQSNVVTLFQNVIAPLLGTAAAVVLIFNIFKLLKHKREGEDFSPNIIAIVISAVIAILFFSFSVWGGGLFS